MSDVPPNVARRAAGLPQYRSPSFGGDVHWRGKPWLKEDVEAQIEFEERQRRSMGRPRCRSSRRVLAGWLAKVAREIQR